MNAERAIAADGRAEIFGRKALVVNGVTGFVQDAEKGFIEEARVVARGDAAIAGAVTAAKGVGRDVEPAGREVKADGSGGGFAEDLLSIDGIFALQDVPRLPAGRRDGGHQWRQLGAQRRE